MNRRFASTALIIAIVIVVAAGGAGYWVLTKEPSTSRTSELTESPTIQENTNVQTPTATKPVPSPSQTSATSGWKKFENKDGLKISFVYPPGWKLQESRTVTYAAGREHMYGTADDDPEGWEESRKNCQGAEQEKYGKPECFSHFFYLDSGGTPNWALGILGVEGKYYFSAPKGGTSLSLTATNLFAQPCTSADQCTIFTNSNDVTIQRRYGSWSMGDGPNYFIYAILPSPTDKQTAGYVFSMERFNNFPNAQPIFDAMLDSVVYIQ